MNDSSELFKKLSEFPTVVQIDKQDLEGSFNRAARQVGLEKFIYTEKDKGEKLKVYFVGIKTNEEIIFNFAQFTQHIPGSESPEFILKDITAPNLKILAGSFGYRIEKSSINSLSTHRADFLKILDSKVYDLLIDGIGSLIIEETNILNTITIKGEIQKMMISMCSFKKLNIDELVEVKDIDFDDKTSIKENPYHVYKGFLNISRNNNDRLQSHIFHSKLIDEYVKLNKTDLDSRLLNFLQRWSNNYGRSFVLPVFLLFSLNLLFLLLIDCTLWERFIDISPLNTVLDSIKRPSDLQIGLDGLRRVFLTIFIYQVIISARRFAFKFGN